MIADYQTFLASKRHQHAASGFTVDPAALHPRLYPFQRDLVCWALRLGKAAILAGTGLGKTIMQVSYADQIVKHTGLDVLILAPLAVAQQTVREASTIDVTVRYCRHQSEVRPGITITNYDMLHEFDPDAFVGIVLDEASAIKHRETATRTAIVESFRDTPFRLACTATPAPNDYMELGNYAEFLGVMRLTEMLSMYFVHDGGETQQWRLKGHAQGAFWQWLSGWGMMLRRPSDLGYEDGDFILPPLTVEQHIVAADHATQAATGMLLALPAHTLDEQRTARRASINARVDACAALARNSTETWLIWVDLNAEGDAVTAAIPGAVQVAGSDSLEDKASRMLAFADGKIRVLVTKPSVAGFGMNWQHCANVAFVGIGYSWEAYYQAIRRCWRFGQKRPVQVHVITSELEGAVLQALERKETQAEQMADALAAYTQSSMRAALGSTVRQTTAYQPRVPMQLPEWLKGEVA